MIGRLCIEVYEEGEAQAQFSVHGIDGAPHWTDEIQIAIIVFTENLRKLSGKPAEDGKGFCADCGESCDYC